MKRSSLSGFTLIELLVVITIIAILAAILFPVFASAREKARQTSCASNEKQIMIAAGQYSQDYDEYVVTATTPNNGSGWDDLLYPYTANGLNHLANRNEWDVCPDDTIKRAANINPRSYSLNWGGAKYNKNPVLDGPAGGWTTFGGAPAGGGFYAFTNAQIPVPATTILLAERPIASNTVGSNSQAGTGYPNAQIGVSPTGSPVPLHNGGWNYGFTDGHVKWMRPETTMGKSNTGTCAGAVNATSNPCGMWTVDEND